MSTQPRQVTEKPPNTIFVAGDIGLDQLWQLIHEYWDRDEDYGMIWHLPESHPDGIEDASMWDGCPQIIFTRQPIPSDWMLNDGSSH